MDVTRTVLFDSETSKFQTRYFELSPGGYSSFEQHQHEHCVVVLKGKGRVRLGDQWSEIGPNDVIHVGPGIPHQFEAQDETLGILCIVDRERDPAIPIQNLASSETSN
jgi:quercetin dioxygenase-like cupin family protein